MKYSFRLMMLLRSETNFLDKLRRLEMKLRNSVSDTESKLLEQIYVTVEEIAQADRLIRDLKTNHLQDRGSLTIN
jgi:hypothetical protein